MSPALLRRLQTFRRSMAICGVSEDGQLSSSLIYGEFPNVHACAISLFKACRSFEADVSYVY